MKIASPKKNLSPYPSIEELIPNPKIISTGLLKMLTERYAELGPKYLTKEKHTDGRFINDCMNKNSAQDAIEEIVDAIFNVMVLRFKGHKTSKLLFDLVMVYNSLLALRLDIEGGKK